MKDYEKIKKSLKTIKKKGDLYDVLLKRKNRNLSKNSFLSFNVLFYSRILYLGLTVIQKIKSKFAPVKEVKEAQDTLRITLGFPIDIIRYKKKLDLSKKDFIIPYLSIFYENEGIGNLVYIENLKRLLKFCYKYDIEEIILKKVDIMHITSNLTEKSYVFRKLENVLQFYENVKWKDAKEMELELNISYNIKEKLQMEVILLDLIEFTHLIKELEKSTINKETIYKFAQKIQDNVIKKAISAYLINGDFTSLLKAVEKRLTLFLNEEGVFKDKIYGKVFQSVRIHNEFVEVTETLKNGTQLNRRVLSFYEYLEVKNDSELLAKTEKNSDEKELLNISAFYLYLIKNKKIHLKEKDSRDFMSLYDYFFLACEAEQKNKIKKIPGFYSKLNYFKDKLNMIPSVFCYNLTLFVCVFLVFRFYDEINQINSDNSTEITTDYLKAFLEFYAKPLRFELETFVTPFIKNQNKVDKTNISGRTGDVLNVQDELIATVIPLQENIKMPTYFASLYADEAFYMTGNMDYQMRIPYGFYEFQDVEPILEIQEQCSKKDLQDIYFNYTWLFPKAFPVGDNYGIVSISIKDLKDSSKIVKLENPMDSFSKEEIEFLKTFEEPILSYEIGISKENKNEFVKDLKERYPYFEVDRNEIKDAIKRGLNLEKEATLDEIFIAIKEKKYSKTPFKDAGITKQELLSMDVLEYLETISSLDSLVCNLAATLAVGADENLIYVTGYLNYDDAYITTKEAHAWAMNDNGEIMDITPSNLALAESIRRIFAWCLEKHLPFYGILLLIEEGIRKKFGYKILFQIQIKRIEYLLQQPNIEESYVKLMKTLYGGINVHLKRSPSEFVEMLTKDFYGYTKEELKELKKELEESKENELLPVLKVIEEIPFMKEHQEELKRILERK